MSASLVSANHEIAELRAKLDASERAAAEMRSYLELLCKTSDSPKARAILKSSNAGRDYVPRSEVDAAWRRGMTDAHDIVWRANDDMLDSRNPVNVVRQLCDDIRKTRDASELPTELKPAKNHSPTRILNQHENV